MESEIITTSRLPVPPDGTKTNYQKFSQPASRFAIVGCAVMRFPDGKTNIAFTGVSDNAFRDTIAEKVISGNELNDASINKTTEAALQGRDIASDHFASAEYRTHLAKVYLKKALKAVS